MRKQLIATKTLPYAGKQLKAGDEFSASEGDARLLVAIKKAKYATRVMTADTSYATKAMRPEAKPAVPAATRTVTDHTLRLPGKRPE